MHVEREIRACERGFSASCGHAARLILGAKRAPNWRLVASLHRRACRAGDQASCFALAQQYRYGQGVPISMAAASRITRISCNHGHDPACAMLATAPSAAGITIGRRGVRKGSYGGWLGASYVFAPILAPFTAGLGMLLPSVVHWTNDEGTRGLVAPLMMAASTTAGALLGFGLGSAAGDFDSAFGGVVLGSLVGYSGWAIYDVRNNSDRVVRRSRYGLAPSLRRADDGFIFGFSGWF